MTELELLAVLGAGVGAGVLTSTVGVASLLSFPVLLAVGLPPLVANASNTVGLTPGGLAGAFGYRRELARYPRVTVVVLGTCALGAVAGAVLLVALPPGVFEAVVPWLVLGTCLLVGTQPVLASRLRTRRAENAMPPTARPSDGGPAARALMTLTGVYGGYFGAGSGVMMLAVLGFVTDLPFKTANALKTLAVVAANLVATLIFVLSAPLHWPVVAALGLGSVAGGYIGARIGLVLPAAFLRTCIVVMGMLAFIILR